MIHIDISNKKENKFQIHKNIHTKAIDFNWKVKKKTTVKWKTIHIKVEITIVRNRFFSFIGSSSFSTDTTAKSDI